MTTSTPTLAQQFAASTSGHVLEVSLANGVHRHLRCATPGAGEYSFQVTTFPGHLAFTGDMGDYLFAWPHELDVLPFFNHATSNEYYWSKKVVAPTRDQTLVYSPKSLREMVDEYVSEESFLDHDEVSAGDAYASFSSELHSLLFEGDGHDWHSAVEAVNELLEEHGQDELDVDFEDITVSDPTFLRALEAIRWAATTYYATKNAEQNGAA